MTDLLSAFTQVNHHQLMTLANTWLEAGARSFEIRTEDDQIIFSHYSRNAKPSPHLQLLRHPLTIQGQKHGVLAVVIEDTALSCARLKADASLLSELATMEPDFDAMTTELVDVQDQLLAMYQMSESLRGLLSSQDTLEKMVRVSMNIAKAEAAFIMLCEDAKRKVVQHPPNTWEDTQVCEVMYPVGETHTLQAFEYDERTLIVPFAIRGDTINACVGLVKTGRFMAADKKRAVAIAEQISAKLESVLLYEESLNQERLLAELKVAAEFQTRLLPQQLPTIDGLDIAGASIQAKEVGGDFFDFVTTPDAPFLFTVCDVAGKGVPSALLMATTRAVIRSRANVTPPPQPGEVLTHSNADLYDDYTSVGRFATAFVGRYNALEGIIEFANAGHSPVIYRPANQNAHLIEAEDMPIGIMEDTLFARQALTFNQGDILLVATDGFSEATNSEGEMFGYDRLLALVNTYAEASAATISHALFSAIESFSIGHPQDDDQTLVVIRGI